MARSKPFPRLSPEYKEKSGWSTHNPTRKYLLLCISIYGPSIRKTPHTHIRHPVLHSAARHHRLPSSLSERHPRHSHTLPPPVTDPPPPTPLRTFARQAGDTSDCSRFNIYRHLIIYPPPHATPQGIRSQHLHLPPAPHIRPASAGKPRSGRSYASIISLESKV